MKPRKVLVLGGTGFVGSAFCERWTALNGGSGGRMLVPSRRPARGAHLKPLPAMELVAADVHDPQQLAPLVAWADVVVHLVAILHGSAEAFERVHAALPRTLATACRAAGGRRVIHVSALGVDAGAPSDYLRSKAAGEAALQQPGVAWTILRPSVIFGEHDRLMNTFAQLQAVAPFVPLACADARFQPVWVDDVAAAIARAIDDDTTIGQVYELAGPRVMTLAELVQLAGRTAGHERRVIPLPGGLASLQAMVMEALPGEPLMSRDNLRSMQVPNVASGRLPGLEALGITPVAIEAVVPGYLAPARGRNKLNRWRARA